MRRALVLAVAGLVLAAGAPSALAARGSLPKLATSAPPGYGARYAVRPHTIWYTGDSTGIIGRIANTVPAVGKRPGFLHWKTWTRTSADAVGTVWLKNRVPDCATSRFYRFALTLTATCPRNGRFSTMTLRYTYHGQPITDVRCDSGHGYWDLPPDWPSSEDCLARP
jgi:hypothetical protein